MSVEFSAVCPEQPSFEAIGRIAELILGLALDASVPVTCVASPSGAEFQLGSAASTLLTSASPGTHEFSDAFVLTADDRDRSPESRLLALVVVLSGAAMTGGRLLDEAGPLRIMGVCEVVAELLAGPHADAAAILARVLSGEAQNLG